MRPKGKSIISLMAHTLMIDRIRKDKPAVTLWWVDEASEIDPKVWDDLRLQGCETCGALCGHSPSCKPLKNAREIVISELCGPMGMIIR